MKTMKIAVIPDTHFPYCDQKKLSKAIQIISDFQPDAVIQIGDLYDQVSFSNYPKDPSRTKYSPAREMELGRQQAQRMWSDLRSETGIRTKYFQMYGNHDDRLVRKLTTDFPEAAFIGQQWIEKQMTFQGVETVKDEFVLNNIMFMHGMRKMGEHAKWNQMSTVTGHTHQARIEYFMNRRGTYYEMNCGWLGNKSAYPFSYRIQRKLDNTHQGIGLIDGQNPRFVLI